MCLSLWGFSWGGVWVILSIVAEIAHAWNARILRTLMNPYVLGLVLSVVTVLVEFIVYPEGEQASLFHILVGRAAICLSGYVITVHALVRGNLLVLDLVGVDRQHKSRIAAEKAAQKPLRTCLLMACLMVMCYVLSTGAYVVVWTFTRLF